MRYRLTFEVVGQQHLHLYSNADPRTHKDTTQTVPNSKIPDGHWHPVKREADSFEDLSSQYKKLMEWDGLDKDFVRNIKVEVADEPHWNVYRPEASQR